MSGYTLTVIVQFSQFLLIFFNAYIKIIPVAYMKVMIYRNKEEKAEYRELLYRLSLFRDACCFERSEQ